MSVQCESKLTPRDPCLPPHAHPRAPSTQYYTDGRSKMNAAARAKLEGGE